MRRILAFVSLLLWLVVVFGAVGQPIHAQQQALPAPICALTAARVVCYSVERAIPRFVTLENERVTDFALSPDAEWFVYRTEDGRVQIADLYGERRALLDEGALLPARSLTHAQTITWSPDAVAIAYTVTGGARLALPMPNAAPTILTLNDRQYLNLVFSPNGGRLAAQDDTRGWVVFSLTGENGLRREAVRIGSYDVPSDAAWFDDNSLAVAPDSGGLARINVIYGNISALEFAWQYGEGFFTRLTYAFDRTLRALRYNPTNAQAQVITIESDGAVAVIGERQVDALVGWIGNGSLLAYITSGTPLIINPVSGFEDALPIQRANRFTWGLPVAPRSAVIALDADVYYLAPDGETPLPVNLSAGATPTAVPIQFEPIGPRGRLQVWRLAGDGQNGAVQLTRTPDSITEFALSPDRRQFAVVINGILAVVPAQTSAEAAQPTTTPNRRQTPTPEPQGIPGIANSRLLVRLNTDQPAAPAWSPDGRLIAYADADGVNVIAAPAFSNGQPLPSRLLANNGEARAGSPRFSADGRSLLIEINTPNAPRRYQVIPLVDGAFALPAFEAELAIWGFDAIFYVQKMDGVWAVKAHNATGEAVLARSPYPIVAVQPIGGGAGIQNQAAVFLRHVGWQVADAPVALALQRCTTTSDPDNPRVETPPYWMPAETYLSPTGRYASGLVRSRSGRIEQLLFTDLENGLKTAIRGAGNIAAPEWIR